VNELELVARLVPYLAGRGGDLVIGAGEDDAAAWREDDGTFTVATCDTSVESVHFDLSRQAPEDVGWRALCFALGDLAAKGAWPTYGLSAVSVPRRWDETVTERIYAGLAELASAVGLRMVGGDTTLAPGQGSLTLMLLGSTNVEPRPRSAARPGWLVGVTGPLGGAGVHWRRPRPRLEVGTRMSIAGVCCGDISDGLLRELDKFSVAARVGARLRLDAVPCAEGSSPLQAVVSGEEVELVCCGPAPLPRELTVVGELTAGDRVVLVDATGHEVQVEERGYDHFA
jgi:thiamine-monophosphate kinase